MEGTQRAARLDPDLRRIHQRPKYHRGASVATVAIARKLAVRLYWRLRSWSEKRSPVRTADGPGLFMGGAHTPSVI